MSLVPWLILRMGIRIRGLSIHSLKEVVSISKFKGLNSMLSNAALVMEHVDIKQNPQGPTWGKDNRPLKDKGPLDRNEFLFLKVYSWQSIHKIKTIIHVNSWLCRQKSTKWGFKGLPWPRNNSKIIKWWRLNWNLKLIINDGLNIFTNTDKAPIDVTRFSKGNCIRNQFLVVNLYYLKQLYQRLQQKISFTQFRGDYRPKCAKLKRSQHYSSKRVDILILASIKGKLIKRL